MLHENKVLKYFAKFTVKYQRRALFFSKVTKHLLTVVSDFYLEVLMKQKNCLTPLFKKNIQ